MQQNLFTNHMSFIDLYKKSLKKSHISGHLLHAILKFADNYQCLKHSLPTKLFNVNISITLIYELIAI